MACTYHAAIEVLQDFLSEYDIALINDDRHLQSLELGRPNGFKVKTMPDRIGRLTPEQARILGLRDVQIMLSKQAGRPVEFMFYDSISGALSGPSHIVQIGK